MARSPSLPHSCPSSDDHVRRLGDQRQRVAPIRLQRWSSRHHALSRTIAASTLLTSDTILTTTDPPRRGLGNDRRQSEGHCQVLNPIGIDDGRGSRNSQLGRVEHRCVRLIRWSRLIHRSSRRHCLLKDATTTSPPTKQVNPPPLQTMKRLLQQSHTTRTDQPSPLVI